MSSGTELLLQELGMFARAAKTVHLPIIFTDAKSPGDPVVFVNDAFVALTGLGREAILDQPLDTLLGEVTDLTSLSAIRRQMLVEESGAWEMPCRRTDGTAFTAAIFFSPVEDDNAIVRRHFFVIVELGGQVEWLLEQRNAMHALYAQAPGFISTSTGPEHRFSFANASYKRFVARDDLIGKPVAEALPEMVDQGFLKVLDEVYHTGKPYTGTGMPMGIVIPETGEIEMRYCDFVYQPVRDASGKITGLFCEGYDVTEQRETADRLSMLQAQMIHLSRVNAMGTMATTLAHELNQPLAAIGNYATGLARMAEAGPIDRENLGLALRGIQEATQRAGDIIQNLRDLTRRRGPERTSFDLGDAVSECIRLVQATVPPSIIITTEIAPDTRLAADRVQIQQVIINLLRNACDAVMATPVKNVTVSTRTVDANLVVCICDSGAGVPVEVAERIFSWSESSKEGGMGLGLSICRTIIEAHHGRIWLEDSGTGGSEFCFSMPMQEGLLPTKGRHHR
ncbi:sensor histidine kinase [Blastomonas aquatica]|uniref:histidine kinase n=1 Tax=Blastomonas aquatica TaxID=1510276 RepID=A0ABQ1JF58_9SPHN|nr:ATP-binding protein [Blastomonas aquatica]GGB65677.1 hypothetical protein GCM10010833_21070 [Blastomonas aquatica]